jgi:hypothetical protein
MSYLRGNEHSLCMPSDMIKSGELQVTTVDDQQGKGACGAERTQEAEDDRADSRTDDS